jgi:hypothetical protein
VCVHCYVVVIASLRDGRSADTLTCSLKYIEEHRPVLNLERTRTQTASQAAVCVECLAYMAASCGQRTTTAMLKLKSKINIVVVNQADQNKNKAHALRP